MKLKILLGISFWMLIFMMSCSQDEIRFDKPTAELRFSTDTLFCDTVYNQARSETYAVKVYNKEDNDIEIPKIYLKGGASSLYRINVDGASGTEFSSVPLRKKDSLYIFVEIAPVANAPEAIAEDQIVFDLPAGAQHVTLLSVVQDAEYFIQSDSNPNILAANTVWDNQKAKIIYGNLTLAEGKTLDIKEGTQIYFTKNSSLTVSKNATLNVSGTLDKEVVFRGDRSDTKYDTIPMNWKGISFDEGAVLNMNYARIFGGETGIALNTATATLQNTIIHTFQNFGIKAIASVVKASNLVMNNCGQADLAIQKGGTVTLTHCTLANFWELNASLPAYGIYASNEIADPAGQKLYGAVDLNIRNSIIYGHRENALSFDAVSGQSFRYSIDGSLIKYGDQSGFSFDGNPWITHSVKNEDPKFKNYFIHKMNLRVADDSPAKALGTPAAAQEVPYDIKGIARKMAPTAGAYQ